MTEFIGFVLERDLIADAIAEFERVMQALVHRHGPAFRQLERDIDAWAKIAIEDDPPGVEDLGGGRFVITPPAGLQAILADARALGV